MDNKKTEKDLAAIEREVLALLVSNELTINESKKVLSNATSECTRQTMPGFLELQEMLLKME